jgi:hypothetical protein
MILHERQLSKYVAMDRAHLLPKTCAPGIRVLGVPYSANRTFSLPVLWERVRTGETSVYGLRKTHVVELMNSVSLSD